MKMKWDLVLGILGFVTSVSASVGYVVYNEGTQDRHVEFLTEKVREFEELDKLIHEFDKELDRHSTELTSLKSYSIANKHRVDGISNLLGQMNSDQKVMEVVIRDLTKAVNSLSENTASLITVVKEVAVLDQRVKHLEKDIGK